MTDLLNTDLFTSDLFGHHARVASWQTVVDAVRDEVEPNAATLVPHNSSLQQYIVARVLATMYTTDGLWERIRTASTDDEAERLFIETACRQPRIPAFDTVTRRLRDDKGR